MNISVVNNEVIIALTVAEQNEANALIAAIRAEEAKQAAQQARGISETAAENATTEANRATEEAGNAFQQSQDAMLARQGAKTAEQGAVTAQSASEQAATTATQKASEANLSFQTAQTEAEKAATEAGKAQSSATTATQKASEATQEANRAKTEADRSALQAGNATQEANRAHARANDAESFAQQAGQQLMAVTEKVLETKGYRDESEAIKNQTVTLKAETETVRQQAIADVSQVKTETEQVKADAVSETQSLLVNFFDPEIIALNLRAINEGAEFQIKLRHVQSDMDNILTTMNPSLLMIPSAVKAGTLYSVLPEDGTGDFTVSRNGEASYTDKDGVMRMAPANVPRLDFDPVTGEFKGVLVEPSATNLLLHSESFDNNFWVKGVSGQGLAPILTPNYALSPNGLMTADRAVFEIAPTASDSQSSIISSSFSPTGASTLSVWIKSNTSDTYNMRLRSKIQSILITVTPEWRRFEITANNDQNEGFNLNLRVNNQQWGGTDTFADVLIWGAQIEQGPVATSYIPTAGSTVTRPADIITRNNAEHLIGQSEGSVFWEGSFINQGSFKGLFSLRNAELNRSLNVYLNNNVNLRTSYNLGNGSTDSFLGSISGTGLFRFCLVYKQNQILYYVNGVPLNPLNVSGSFNFNSIGIGATNTTGGSPLNDHIKSFALSKRALTEAEAIELTTL